MHKKASQKYLVAVEFFVDIPELMIILPTKGVKMKQFKPLPNPRTAKRNQKIYEIVSGIVGDNPQYGQVKYAIYKAVDRFKGHVTYQTASEVYYRLRKKNAE